MKLIYAIIRDDNKDEVVSCLTKEGFSVTKISSSGGFLRRGNTTLMIGVADDKLQSCIGIIKKECGPHQTITVNMPYVSGTTIINCPTAPTQIDVGGATIFVIDVQQFIKF